MSQIIESIVSQHLEEAAFLWMIREGAADAPHYCLDDLTKHDNRIEAHLDGLRIAGEEGWEICKDALSQEEAGEVFVASHVAFMSGDPRWIDVVLEVGSTTSDLARGVISSLGWLPYVQVDNSIKELLSAESSVLRRIGLAACTIHRQDPGPALNLAIESDDLLLRARAIKAAGELGRKDLIPTIHSHLQSDDEVCRFAAACAGALLGEAVVLPILQTFTYSRGTLAENAFGLALRFMPLLDAFAWQRELAAQPEFQRMAVQSVGVLGDPVGIPWLIHHMMIPKLARVAGESFSMITGVDIAYEDLEGEWPQGFEVGPTEEPEDEDVAMDPDEDLPWPNPELIDAWWATNAHCFSNGTRYLCGKPMTLDSLKEIRRAGYQRQRMAAALELTIRQPGTPLFNTRTPGFRQQQLLGVDKARV